MFVIFWVDEKRYYSNDQKCHWTEDTAKAATYKSFEAAVNYAKSGLKDKLHQLEFIEKGCEPKCIASLMVADNTSTYTKEEAEQAYEELRKAAQVFGEAAAKMPAIMKYYKTVQTEQNKLQEDLLHKFEFTSPGNIIFVKLGRMLNKCRLTRREAKDRIGYMCALSNAKPCDVLKVHNGHDHMIETRAYEPRIAPELFE